ncbi:MAG TPA: DoxX family membrane protein [Candidatus Paceibacterota bacterium]
MEIFSFVGKVAKDNLDILILRIGLGLVFLYAGTAAMQDPTSWIGFVPQFVQTVIPRETFLFFHSVFQIGLGAGLIIGAWIPILSILAFLSMFSILTLFGIDEVTFRDFGLACMALALFVRVTYKK